MRVNIVTEGAWIKRYWSDMIVKWNQTNKIYYSISSTPINDTDFNFYICYNTYLPFPKSKVKDVGYVTHIHANDIQAHSRDIGKPFDKFRELDAWIHQSNTSLTQFIHMGYPKEKNFLLTSGIVTENFRPTITLGIIQNGEVVGKGLHFMCDLVDKFDLKNFKFIICGRGWELFTNKLRNRGIRFEEYKYTPAEYYTNKQAELYEKMDYFLVPSLWEGGPVAVMEALASGRPIIASNVGYVPEFNVEYMYDAGDLNGLTQILKDIQSTVLERVNKVAHLSFIQYNNRLLEILSKI